MATLSPSTTIGTPIPTTTLKNKNPSLPKLSRLPLNRSSKSNQIDRKFTCKASQNNNDQDPQNPKMDRRNMNILLGLGGLYGATTSLTGAPNTMAAPAVIDLNAKCEPTKDFDGTPAGVYCCPPYIDPSKVTDFDPKNYPTPALRVRSPAQKMDPNQLAKFKKAVRMMRELPDEDPLSWKQQADVHCAYCNLGYRQLGNDDKYLQVHYSWLFFPFHRAYLFFFERILGKLIGDPTLAIPYWNWDHPDGMRMPTIYNDGGSIAANPLYDPLRNPAHLPPKVMDLSYNGVDHDTPDDTQIYNNLWHMYIHMVRPRKPELFLGGKYFAGEDIPDVSGALELLPHNTVHSWTGSLTTPETQYNENMGTFYSAARDPIFYGHHANVDRMWSVWKNLDGGRPNFDDADWLNNYFVFYDENRQPVKIYVRDVLDEKRLGYMYQEQALPWLDPEKPKAGQVSRFNSIKPAKPVAFPKELGKGFRTKVSRPQKKRSKREKREKEEVLEVTMKLGKTDEFVKFDVYLNTEKEGDTAGVTKAELSYAGSFTSLSHFHGGRDKKVKVKMPISEILEDIEAENDDFVDVVFAARSGQEAVTITDVQIMFI